MERVCGWLYGARACVLTSCKELMDGMARVIPVAAKIYIGGCLGVCLRGYGGHWLGITSGGVAAKELFNGASHIYIILRFSAMLPVLSQSIVSVPQSVVAMNVVECVRAMVIRVVICMIVAGACKGFKLGPSSIFSFALLFHN